MTTAVHEITVEAAPVQVFELLADVTNWPRLFPPTLHVDWLAGGANWERVRIWATLDGEVRSWACHRVIDPVSRRIEFTQEAPSYPVAELRGSWQVHEHPDGGSVVRLRHDYRAVEDDLTYLGRISRAVERSARAELSALRDSARAAVDEGLSLSFSDSMRITGRARSVFEFVHQAAHWPDRLPHVAAVQLREPEPGVQSLTLNTRGGDGSVHTTHSYRICLAPDVIAYKQTVLPHSLALHTGRWTFRQDGDEVLASAEHTVVLNSGGLPPGLDLAEARTVVRQALGGTSLATLTMAKAHVESR